MDRYEVENAMVEAEESCCLRISSEMREGNGTWSTMQPWASMQALCGLPVRTWTRSSYTREDAVQRLRGGGVRCGRLTESVTEAECSLIANGNLGRY